MSRNVLWGHFKLVSDQYHVEVKDTTGAISSVRLVLSCSQYYRYYGQIIRMDVGLYVGIILRPLLKPLCKLLVLLACKEIIDRSSI